MQSRKRSVIDFQFHSTLTFFKNSTYPYGLREDLIARLELNSAEKILLASGDTAAIYKISDIALEYDAIFDLD